MALEQHSTLGALYLSTPDFKSGAAAYGAQAAIVGKSDPEIQAVLALASRAIDAYCEAIGFGGIPGLITENHRVPNVQTNLRIYVHKPPVLKLEKLQLRISPSGVVDVPLTPEGADTGSRIVRYGDVYYSYTEKYLEVASYLTLFHVAGGQWPAQFQEVQAEVTYRNTPDNDTVSALVAAATGYQAAYMLNLANVDSIIAPGIDRMSTPELSLTRASQSAANNSGGVDNGMAPMVATLLRAKRRITVR